MSKTCTLDTSFLLSFSKEEEDESLSCHYFLDNVKEEVYIPQTVKAEYFEVVRYRLHILHRILKEIEMNKPKTFDDLRNEIKKVFNAYRRNPSIDRSTKYWIKAFEAFFSKRSYELHDDGTDNLNILIVLKADLSLYNTKLLTSFDIAKTKCKGELNYNPCQDLCQAIKNIIPNQDKDAEHLSVSIELGIRNNIWVFFVSLDDTHILKHSKKFHRHFHFVIPTNPLYALDELKKFNRGLPLDSLKLPGMSSHSIRILNRISEKNFGIKILPN